MIELALQDFDAYSDIRSTRIEIEKKIRLKFQILDMGNICKIWKKK